MKSLRESILDDDEDILVGTQDDINDNILNGPSSPLDEIMFLYDNRHLIDIHKQKRYRYNKNKEILYIHPDISNPHLSYIPKPNSDYEIKQSIKDICPNIKTIDINKGAINIDCKFINSLDEKYICKNIICNSFYIEHADKISNINITSYNNNYQFVNYIRYCKQLKNVNLAIADPIMSFYKTRSNMNELSLNSIPIFNNCKITGYNAIKIYDVFLFDEICEKLNNLFDLSFTPQYNDNGNIAIRKNNSIKKLLATFNNPKKYQPVDRLYDIKKDAKMSDIVGYNPDKYLSVIELQDNNVIILAIKDKKYLKEACAKGFDLYDFRTIAVSKNKNGVYNVDDFPKTSDGWYIICGKKI